MNNTRSQREHDIAVLAAGGNTGWWDETGQPAPWPQDFFNPDTDWRPDTNPPPTLARRRAALLTRNRRISRYTTPGTRPGAGR